MGVIIHHSIVVTAHEGLSIGEAWHAAKEIFPWVSPISPTTVNGTCSFFIPPDGSKEFWPESNDGNNRRDKFVEWLRSKTYGDGSSPYTWYEVAIGELDYIGGVEVVRSSEDHYMAAKRAVRED